MQQMSCPPVQQPNLIAVVSPQFVSPYTVDLTITKKFLSLQGSFEVLDVNGKVFLRVEEKMMSLTERHTLVDAADNPILSLQRVPSLHNRRMVFRGDSSDPKDLIFSAKESSFIQLTASSLDVFLASNKKEKSFDFKVEGSGLGGPCTIHPADGKTIIAQMEKKHVVQSFAFGNDTFAVTVYPHVDCAFIVALIVSRLL